MKKILLILVMALIICMSMSERSLAPPYSVICIDPGHGGRGADKFHNGGDGYGTSGPVLGIAEQWVNWQVACPVRDSILYQLMFPVIMTREVEADTNLPPTHTENLWYRINKANYGGEGGGPVTHFISIHHNGYTPYPGTQGTEVWWSSETYTDSSYGRDYGYWRPANVDSLLAWKSHLRLLETWNYRDRCLTRCEPGSGSSFCCDETLLPPSERKFVLKNTVMPSALSEASNLKDTTEELLFDDPNSGHADSEAVALYHGWYSHAENAGIAIVRNAYEAGNEGEVIIADWACDNDDTVSSPYVRCWLEFEEYCLKAINPQIINGYEYTFHHWTHLNRMGDQIGDDWYVPEWLISVPAELDYHRYVAYFTGGPYSAEVVSPNGWEIWHVGEQRTITWNVSPGADSTTYVDIFLDRNGGNNGYPEQLLDSIPGAYYDSWTWTVTGPYSANCRMKVVAYDRAGNSAWDVSNYDFSISDTGNNNPVMEGHLECKYPQEECNECKKYGESFALQIEAHDLDADSIYYEWYCLPWGGHFPNGQNTMTTAQNYVVYTAPTKAEYGGKNQFEDFLKVTVVDVRGGSNDTSGYLTLYDPGTSCLCGDVNAIGEVDIGDIVYLVNYLYTGTAPPDPLETGDVNNDCEVDVGDVTYLLNYLFVHTSPPECGWICPDEKLAESF